MTRPQLTLALAALTAVLVTAAPAGAATGIAPARGFAPHQVVLKFHGERGGRTVSLPLGVSVMRTAATLRQNPAVAYAEPNYIASASALEPLPLPNDPGTLGGASEAAAEIGGWTSKQWSFLPWQDPETSQSPTSPGGINVVGAWRNLAELGDPGGAGQRVAVLDTGIAYRSLGNFKRSPDFGRGQVVAGYDFVEHDRIPLDENGHGTFIAGTIGEKTNNSIGLTGIAYRAQLLAVRVLDKHGRGDATEIAKGINYAVAHHASVINMSFNFACGKKVPVVDEALRHAYDRGVVTVASAGNIGSETCVSEPATGPRVIAVGGSTEGSCLGDYSLSGPIDLLAPGGGEPVGGCPSILARPIYQVTLLPGSVGTFAIPSNYIGTSMAAAHVSGVAAMLLASGIVKTTRQQRETVTGVAKRLSKTARDLGLPRTQQGAGLIDAERATDPGSPPARSS
jgi:serine protease